MTLIDGEMIIDKIPEVGLKRRYLVYDLMAINGSPKVKVWIWIYAFCKLLV